MTQTTPQRVYHVASLDSLADAMRQVASDYRGQIQPALSIVNHETSWGEMAWNAMRGYSLIVIDD
jgi:hypothetical protein